MAKKDVIDENIQAETGQNNKPKGEKMSKNKHLRGKITNDKSVKDTEVSTRKISEEGYGSEDFDVNNASKKHRLTVQKGHFNLHLIILMLMIILVGYTATSGGNTKMIAIYQYITFGLFLITQFIDIMFARNNYGFSERRLKVCKMANVITSMLFTASFMYDSMIAATGTIVLVLMVCEYFECVDVTSTDIRDRFAIIVGGTYILCHLLVMLISKEKTNVAEFIILMIIMAVGIYGLVLQIASHIDQYMEHVIKLNQKVQELLGANDAISGQSKRIHEVVELLGQQKIELKEMNETIKLRSAEMQLSNDILELISEQKDMEKVAKQVTDIIVSRDKHVNCVGIFIDALMYGNSFPLVAVNCGGNTTIENELKERASDILMEIHHFDDPYIFDGYAYPENYAYLAMGGIKSLIRLQITTEGGMCGAMLIGSNSMTALTEETAKFYNTITAQLGIAVRNANLYATMENLATRDGLTGIYNRRHFTKLFSDYVTEAMDAKLPISAALFDIDKFKNVNDTYGHSFGDLVIVTVSHIADEVVRENGGILGRYGGEEFIMAFLNKRVDDTMPIVEEIHKRIKEAELEHNGEKVHVNVSIGVTDYPNTCSNPAELLNHADWAMYYSKQHGRGRITIDNPDVIKEVELQ